MVYASILLLLFLFTLPDSEYPVVPMPDNKPLLVYYDSLWPDPYESISNSLEQIDSLLATGQQHKPCNNELLTLKKAFFSAAYFVNKNPVLLKRYVSLFAEMRSQSKYFASVDSLLYKTSYSLNEGGRTLIEEIFINNKTTVSPDLFGKPALSVTPSGRLGEIIVHSGDILLSKGPEPISQVFSRILDFPSSYSHIAIVYIDEDTDSVSIIEAHPIQGTVIRGAGEFLSLPRKRLMVLRLSSDLQEIKEDPMLPHKAAVYARNDALIRNAPYDFKMDHHDSVSQFCSEIPYYAYKSQGLLLWDPVPQLLSSGNTKMAAGFGIHSPELLLLSNLEYDHRLIITAEWFNKELLYEDHIEMVVMDAMLKRASEKDLDYPFYLLPFARIMKAYSSTVDLFGADPVVPIGMTAVAAARFYVFRQKFFDILKLTREKAEQYSVLNKCLPDIRCLAVFAEESLKECDY